MGERPGKSPLDRGEGQELLAPKHDRILAPVRGRRNDQAHPPARNKAPKPGPETAPKTTSGRRLGREPGRHRALHLVPRLQGAAVISLAARAQAQLVLRGLRRVQVDVPPMRDQMLAGVRDRRLAGVHDRMLAGVRDRRLAGVRDRRLAGVRDRMLAGVRDRREGRARRPGRKDAPHRRQKRPQKRTPTGALGANRASICASSRVCGGSR